MRRQTPQIPCPFSQVGQRGAPPYSQNLPAMRILPQFGELEALLNFAQPVPEQLRFLARVDLFSPDRYRGSVDTRRRHATDADRPSFTRWLPAAEFRGNSPVTKALVFHDLSYVRAPVPYSAAPDRSIATRP